MSEPTFDQVKSQIKTAMAKYRDTDPKTAMLSGMSLAATFLAKLDGSKTMTAATLCRAIEQVGAELGYSIGKL